MLLNPKIFKNDQKQNKRQPFFIKLFFFFVKQDFLEKGFCSLGLFTESNKLLWLTQSCLSAYLYCLNDFYFYETIFGLLETLLYDELILLRFLFGW